MMSHLLLKFQSSLTGLLLGSEPPAAAQRSSDFSPMIKKSQLERIKEWLPACLSLQLPFFITLGEQRGRLVTGTTTGVDDGRRRKGTYE